MTAPMPPCPAWCATHVDLAGIPQEGPPDKAELSASGPNPALAIHRTAPVPIHTSDEEAEVMVLVERLDEPGRPGTAQPYLRVSGVDYGLTVEQVWALSGQALHAVFSAECRPEWRPAKTDSGTDGFTIPVAGPDRHSGSVAGSAES